jgi:hypothetical protein
LPFSFFVVSILFSFHLLYWVHSKLTANVLALGEEADFEALNCLPALNLIRSTKLHLSTEPAFLPNACYRLPSVFCPILLVVFIGQTFL